MVGKLAPPSGGQKLTFPPYKHHVNTGQAFYPSLDPLHCCTKRAKNYKIQRQHTVKYTLLQ
jgi:hypothetical protein